MKLLSVSLATALVAHHVQADATCSPEPLEFSDTIAVRVDKVGSVPAIDTDAFSYNMAVMDNMGGGDVLFFLDQKNGKIYGHDTATGATDTLFDMTTPGDVPAGLALDWTYGGAAQTYRVKAACAATGSRGSGAAAADGEVIVVFTSSTLPPGWTEGDARLPPPGAYGKFVGDATISPLEWKDDIYRVGLMSENFNNGAGLTTITGYDVFYKYALKDGKLVDPRPFFVSETHVCPGHLGGGIVPLADGSLLWSTGDCTIYGLDGHYAPQLDGETCGKILRIDPAAKGAYRIVAKGVRNSQQMRLFDAPAEGGDGRRLQGKSGKKGTGKSGKKGKSGKGGKKDFQYLAFMDIGGVTAEEVNAVALDDLLDDGDGPVPNFGWGRSQVDGRAREGTFHVAAGIMGVLGTQPACQEAAPPNEAGFVQPWIQFGRTEDDYFYAISSLAVPTKGVDQLRMLWSEFNTGKVLGTAGAFVPGAPPVKGYKLKVYDSAGVYLENGLNDLVKEELGDVGYYRGDPRLFHYPDGSAGVFIERTGVFYKITEIVAPVPA